MSEYITIQPEYDEGDPDRAWLITNLPLAPDGSESYANRTEGDEGSPLAQALFTIDGLLALAIDGSVLTVQRDPEMEWHILIEEITDALKDFFL